MGQVSFVWEGRAFCAYFGRRSLSNQLDVGRFDDCRMLVAPKKYAR